MDLLIPIPSLAIVEGGCWAGFWTFSLCSAAQNIQKLIVNNSLYLSTQKVVFAVKKAFVDLCYVMQSTAFIGIWADTLKLVDLGTYLKLAKQLCYPLTLCINSIEASCNIYVICHPDNNQQKIYASLLNLITNVSFVAWSLLSITGAIPILNTPLLLFAGAMVGASIIYKMSIPKIVKKDAGSACAS